MDVTTRLTQASEGQLYRLLSAKRNHIQQLNSDVLFLQTRIKVSYQRQVFLQFLFVVKKPFPEIRWFEDNLVLSRLTFFYMYIFLVDAAPPPFLLGVHVPLTITLLPTSSCTSSVDVGK